MATILIVDDRPTNRQYLLTLLGYTPHRLLEACDGAQALALARRERPDLIITDILMPTMDGYEFVQRLRAEPQLAASRVIFFSASYGMHEMLGMARSCGVHTVLPKPSEPQTILDAVHRELGLDQPPAVPTESAASAAPAEHDPASLSGRLRALETLSLSLIGERRVEAMLAVFQQAASGIVAARYLGICLLDHQERAVLHTAAHGFDGAVLARVQQDDAWCAALLGGSGPRRHSALEGDLPRMPDGHPEIDSFLGLAIRDPHHLYGWLYFADKNGAAQFGSDDERLAQTLAAQLAVAYENINLYQVMQHHAAQLQLEATARQQADLALRTSEERFRAMTDAAPDAIVAMDAEQNILHFNRAAELMFGYREPEVLGRHVTLLIPLRFRAVLGARLARYERTRQPRAPRHSVELYGCKKDGGEFLFELSLSMVSLHGQLLFTGILRDCTQRHALEQRLRLAAQVFDSTQESIMMTDAQANIVAVNPAFEHITGYAQADVLGHNPRLLSSGQHDLAFYESVWNSLNTQGQWRGEILNRRKNGQVYPERMSINVIRDRQDRVSAYVSVSSDVSALKEARTQLDFLAYHDPLTGLPNRALLNDRLQQAIAKARHGSAQIALLVFNIDRLQRINDSLGHEAGDALLRAVARAAGARVAPGDTLAHLGGDEFVLMLTECADSDEIIVAARRLIDDIAQPVPLHGRDVVVTASVGISIFPRDASVASELLKAADVALAHVKETGRNGFRFYTGSMNSHALRWMALETHLRRAIERGELLLHYQPQVALADGRICSVEALLRWNSAELGPVPPGDFIPLAEDTGLILSIGSWVLYSACAQNRAWQDAGLAPMRVAVNVSARQFAAGRLPAEVREVLAATGLAPEYLEIELTESVMMQDSAAVQAQLAELTGLGVSISLDDFGTGYSSLGYLSRFTLDKLKIDQSFVRNITTEPRSAAIAQATIALAHGLGLAVIAEGVETHGQLAYLRTLGCDEIQGYLFSRPVPPGEIAALLRDKIVLNTNAA